MGMNEIEEMEVMSKVELRCFQWIERDAIERFAYIAVKEELLHTSKYRGNSH